MKASKARGSSARTPKHSAVGALRPTRIGAGGPKSKKFRPDRRDFIFNPLVSVPLFVFLKQCHKKGREIKTFMGNGVQPSLSVFLKQRHKTGNFYFQAFGSDTAGCAQARFNIGLPAMHLLPAARKCADRI